MRPEIRFGEGSLCISHILNVPQTEAFCWWAERERLERWSGCAEMVHCAIEMDFRVGGSFLQTMEIRDKGMFRFHGIYDEIVEPERIAWRAFFGPVITYVVVEFIALGERTKVVLTQTGFPDERSVKIVGQGTEESFRLLGEILNSSVSAIAQGMRR